MSATSKATKDDIQRNRDEAYQVGWEDGYAEGFGKAIALAVAAFPAETAYGRGGRARILSSLKGTP